MSLSAPVPDPLYRPGTTYGDIAADRIRFCSEEISRRKPGTVIDVGCWPGHLSRILKERFPHLRLFGTGLLSRDDFRSDMQGVLDELAEVEFDPFYNQGAEISRRTPWPDGCADMIIACEILEHITDPLPMLREFRRLLGPHGCILITTPNVSSLGAIARLVRGRSNYEAIDRSVICIRNDWRAHIRLYAKDEIADLASRCGLAMSHHHYYVTRAIRCERIRNLGWFTRWAGSLIPRWREDQMAILTPIAELAP